MILVDSDILISHRHGIPPAKEWLSAAAGDGQLHISAVTVAEVTGGHGYPPASGMRSPERHATAMLLDAFVQLPVSLAVARRAGQLMRQYRSSHGAIGLGDYLIAATAETHDLDLATLNVRQFPMFNELRPPFTLPA